MLRDFENITIERKDNMAFVNSFDEIVLPSDYRNFVCSRKWFEANTRPIYVYGAGQLGRYVFHVLVGFKLYGQVKGFLDDDPTRVRYLNRPVYEPDYPKNSGEDPVVIISVDPHFKHEVPIIKNCQRLGYEYVTFRQFILNQIALALTMDELENNAEAIRALSIWDEQESHDTYKNMLRAIATRNEEYLPRRSPSQYFISLVPGRYYRSFLDCGAYTGDVIHQLKQYTRDNFDNYYLVEGDPTCMWELRNAASKDPRFTVFETLLSNYKGTANFANTHTCGRITSDDNYAITLPCDTIDNLFADKPVTAIKMDIEGEEVNALDGARKVITEQRPVLIISMYHKIQDFWEVPLWIHDAGLDYSIYCRHHSPGLTETICYAIPK